MLKSSIKTLSARNSPPGQQKSLLINEQLINLMKNLAKYHITHGDLKHTNILVTKDKIVLTDLDSMRFHNLGWLYKAGRTRDMNQLIRFARNSEDLNQASKKLSR